MLTCSSELVCGSCAFARKGRERGNVGFGGYSIAAEEVRVVGDIRMRLGLYVEYERIARFRAKGCNGIAERHGSDARVQSNILELALDNKRNLFVLRARTCDNFDRLAHRAGYFDRHPRTIRVVVKIDEARIVRPMVFVEDLRRRRAVAVEHGPVDRGAVDGADDGAAYLYV